MTVAPEQHRSATPPEHPARGGRRRMISVRRRIGAGFAVMLVLFLAVVLIQVVVGDRLQNEQRANFERLERAAYANRAVLQHMTDAETGVRGFQFTGEQMFLDPYDNGRKGAFTSFDVVEGSTSDSAVRQALYVQRQAVSHWLYAYAIPIVNAGVADPDEDRASRGKGMFDEIRTSNAAVDAAIRGEQRAVTAADSRRARTAQLLFGGLAVVFLVVAGLLAVVYQRHLLTPLEDIRRTLLRLTTDRSARAIPSGPAELRAVAGSLNRLAAQTERLLDEEHARSVHGELRQAVAVAMRGNSKIEEAASRLAALIGAAMGADAVHGRVVVRADAALDVCWPTGAAALSPRTVTDILDGTAGTVAEVRNTAGGIAVPLAGDGDCPPGLIHLARYGDRPWTGDECSLLETLAREIEHVLRQWRLQDRQARLIVELRDLDERKDSFVATATHELRTPLTSILGYAEMLADGDGGDLSPLQRRDVSAIQRNAVRLQDTIADLMLIRPAANRSGGPVVPVDLSAVTSAAQAWAEPAARAKGLVVAMHTEPVWVSGDAGQLERAVRNLIGNAVKFTPTGGRISCRLTGAGARARLVVADTGIGIPAGDLPGLYTPFHRAVNAMDQAVQGSGLGLAIVHAIVTEHGGAVAVESAPGRGSTFTLTLPAVEHTGPVTVGPAEPRPEVAAISGPG